jgi:hypothetical protein
MTEQSEINNDQQTYLRNLPNEPSISISQLYNETNLRSPNPSPSPEKINSECKFKKMEVAVRMMNKFVSFFVFHFKLAPKDLMSQWRIDTLMETIPTSKELKFLLKKKLLNK